MIEIRRITFEEAKTLFVRCKVKGMNFDECNCYYGLFADGKMVSIASYKKIGKGVHFKSNYTLEEHQGKGYMTKLIESMISLNRFENMKAYCLKSSYKIYGRLGFNLLEIKHHKYFDTYIMEKK